MFLWPNLKTFTQVSKSEILAANTADFLEHGQNVEFTYSRITYEWQYQGG